MAQIVPVDVPVKKKRGGGLLGKIIGMVTNLG